MSCYPFFLLTTSITTILPLAVNADSINHFESVWNDMRHRCTVKRPIEEVTAHSLPLSQISTPPWQSTSGGPERSDTRTYIAVLLRRDEYMYEGPKKVSSGTLFANETGSHCCSDQYRK